MRFLRDQVNRYREQIGVCLELKKVLLCHLSASNEYFLFLLILVNHYGFDIPPRPLLSLSVYLSLSG